MVEESLTPDDVSRETEIEYGHLMSDGGIHIWPNNPEIERIFPLEMRIQAGKRFGGKVYTRKIIIVSDWEEVHGENLTSLAQFD